LAQQNEGVDPLVANVVALIRKRDWVGVKPKLHPYLHWTGRDGRVIRGRTNVLGHFEDAPLSGPPASHEIRDRQIYRWVE
jgi:hypothetical protein